MTLIESDIFSERMRAAVSFAWGMFSRKVGSGMLPINKEASMQLQYAYVLQQLLPLIAFHDEECYEIELETGVKVNGRGREIDLLFSGSFQGREHKIAVEMKCYRTLASSGGKRGATDIFMKDVYFDLYLLERYVASGVASAGVSLVMNDMDRLIHPTAKDAKCWHYDISQGAIFGPDRFDTPIGGKEVDFSLDKRYALNWRRFGAFWFLEAEGTSCEDRLIAERAKPGCRPAGPESGDNG
ncbi:hypothetical protein [Denitromonas halophila]|uniref:hypothetical protein n=1 Tax=Denitromonas halophila TaxID=1629404 RepID=UPI001642D8D3|nr:hypothetical protein [Denitromonas halophila]